MGVPGFFLKFLKKYKNKNFILKKDHIINNNIDFDSLLIDTNCLLHPQCFKVLAENSKATDMKDLERKMLNGCIEYLEYIIDYVNPKKEIQYLSDLEIKNIIKFTKKILFKAIDLGGSSIKDFSSSSGKKGSYQQHFSVYGKKGENCEKKKCNGNIVKIILANRASYYCPKCQK